MELPGLAGNTWYVSMAGTAPQRIYRSPEPPRKTRGDTYKTNGFLTFLDQPLMGPRSPPRVRLNPGWMELPGLAGNTW